MKPNCLSKILLILLFSNTLLTAQKSNPKDSLRFFNPQLTLKINSIKFFETEIKKIRYTDIYKREIDFKKLAWVGGFTIASGIAVHLYEANSWWREPNTDFHITWDTKYALGVDKYGHFFASGLLSHAFSSTIEAANVDLFTSAWLGTGIAFAYEMFVEIEDGFGPNWGFSPGDAIADFLGASYYIAQHYFPILQNFQPKVSYFPSQKFLEGETKAIIIDDYEGQTFWVSARINNLLPKYAEKYWPDWLMLSFGSAARELDGRGGGYLEYYIALDFDADYLPLHGRFGQFIKNTLNYLHFPMPGIRISPKTTAFAIIF